MTEPCEFLPWDTEFFRSRVGRVNANRLTVAGMRAALDWCKKNRIDGLCFLADSADSQTIRIAERNRFALVDIRVTLECLVQSDSGREDGRIRLYHPDDLPALREIAEGAHHDSRFYSDYNFRRELCDEFYRTWITRDCEGYAQAVFVAEDGGEPAGYISCYLGENRIGRIGLIGVAQRSQGKGLGTALIERALHWFAQQRIVVVSVVTQGRNVQAQRLYQRAGFVTANVQFWYHRWFTKE